MYKEISKELYFHTVLHFSIKPTSTGARLDHITSGGDKLHIKDAATRTPFFRLPYNRLRDIRIDIEAAEDDEPAQLYALWKEVRVLIELLSHSKSLPRVEINFKDGKSCWFLPNGTPRTSSNFGYFQGNRDFCPDCNEIAFLFSDLRNAKKATINLPQQLAFTPLWIKDDEDVIPQLAEQMEWKEDINTHLAPGTWPQDDFVNEIYQATYCKFEYALGIMPGSVARMMRLERFATWFDDGDGCSSEYLEWDRINWNSPYIGKSVNSYSDLLARFAFYVAFMPSLAEILEVREVCRSEMSPRFEGSLNWASRLAPRYSGHGMGNTRVLVTRAEDWGIMYMSSSPILDDAAWTRLQGNFPKRFRIKAPRWRQWMNKELDKRVKRAYLASLGEAYL